MPPWIIFLNDRLHSLTPRRFDKRLRFHAQCVGDASDVVEVGDDLGGIMDGSVIKAVLAQVVKIRRNHIALKIGQLDRIFTESHIGGRESRLTPIAGNGMHELVGSFGIIELVVDLSTEVVGV